MASESVSESSEMDTPEKTGTSVSVSFHPDIIFCKGEKDGKDIKQEMERLALSTAERALKASNVDQNIAKFLRKSFDKKFGKTWICVVGSDFGCSVPTAVNNQIGFNTGIHRILLYQTGLRLETGDGDAISSETETLEKETTPVSEPFHPVRIFSDGTKEMQAFAFSTTERAMKATDDQFLISKYIRQTFDKGFGKSWQCIVGKAFGYSVEKKVDIRMEFSTGSYRIILLEID